MRTHRVSWPKTLLLALATVPFLYPFAFLIATAVKPVSEFQESSVALPSNPTTENLTDAWGEAGLGNAMLHSLLAVGISVAVTVLISACGAFWFLTHRGRISKTMRTIVVGTMALPASVFVIPLFVMLTERNWTNNLIVLGFVYAAWNAGFGTYLMYAYFDGLPGEILEAARVDGASEAQQLFRMLLPLSRPALATLAALAFLWSWSDLLISVILVQDPGRRTVTSSVALLADQFSTNTPRLAAGVLIALVPTLLVFAFGQRYIARGVTAGVGK